MSKKEEKRIFEGLITESLPNAMFRVLLDKDNRVVLGCISGKIRRGSIRILPGDRVKIELSQYDDARGRIIFRLPPKKPSEN
nr:translation initiation factor 1 [Rhododendron albrechtii]BCT72586.1 translation initiation factor 1 [Rhododendron albrechtii]